MSNFLLQADGYKYSHVALYPHNITNNFAYYEARGGVFDKIPFFGMQYYLKKYLCGKVADKDKLDEAEDILNRYFQNEYFPRDEWQYIIDEYDGHLPITIMSVPEGTILDPKEVMFTVDSKDDKCAWLTSNVETLISKIWYPTAVSAQSYFIKRSIRKFLLETGGEMLDLRCHDFGYRGVSSEETAAIGGAAHLLHFNGTDTIAGIKMIIDYYNGFAGTSIPATEHSVATMWGKDREDDYFVHCLDTYPTGGVSVVIDSYNPYVFVSDVVCKYKDKILSRDGFVCLRPDTGDPRETLIRILSILEKTFPITLNKEGYKCLPPQLSILQGDGVSKDTIPLILETIKSHGWSAGNIVFGSGGALLQKLSRDDIYAAYKTSSAVMDGVVTDIQKLPFADMSKASKPGRLGLNDNLKTVTEAENTMLKKVFDMGELLIDDTFADIKGRL